jgi:hypothetical protein
MVRAEASDSRSALNTATLVWSAAMSQVILQEEWRPVVGFEGFYEVSNYGSVRGVDRMIPSNKPGLTRLHKGRILKPSTDDRGGYLFVVLVGGGAKRIARIHALVLEAFVGPKPEGMQARHYPDPNKLNNRADNLIWGTPKENAEDREEHGSTCRADNHWARRQPERFRSVVQESAWKRSENRKSEQPGEEDADR